MEIPITRDLTTERGIFDIRIAETAIVEFNLGDTEDEYVDVGAIEGRIVVDYQINRTGLIDRLDRIDNPTISDRLNMFLEDWSPNGTDPNEVHLDYGTLLLSGTNPMEIDERYELGDSFSRERLRSLSPEALRRELRTEQRYETRYEDIEVEIRQQLEREGIHESVGLPAPVRLQARAIPGVEGTNFTITIENTQPSPLVNSKLEIEMPSRIGREVELGHTDGEQDLSGLQGSYDPEHGTYTIDIESIPGSTDGDATDVPFHVNKTAPEALERLAGEAEFIRTVPFSDLEPVGLFDSGGYPINADEAAAVTTRGKIIAEFETPISDITIDQQDEITKKARVDGIPPSEDVISRIEERIHERGVRGYEQAEITKRRNIREGTEVTMFQTSFKQGRVYYKGAEIEVTVKVDGERRTAQRESARDADENLPAERKSVAVETGQTGVTITGDGIETATVDEYISELRDDLKMTLTSLAEEF